MHSYSQKKYYVYCKISHMNVLKKAWFWLLLISIVAFIVGFILFETQGQTSSGKIVTPWWVWMVFGVALGLFIIALIMYLFDVAAYHRQREIAIACGEWVFPEERKIECPKKCVKKEVIECADKDKCGKTTKKVISETPIDKPEVKELMSSRTSLESLAPSNYPNDYPSPRSSVSVNVFPVE